MGAEKTTQFVRCPLTKHQPNTFSVCLCVLSFTTTASCFLAGWQSEPEGRWAHQAGCCSAAEHKSWLSGSGRRRLIGAQQGWQQKRQWCHCETTRGLRGGTPPLTLHQPVPPPFCTPHPFTTKSPTAKTMSTGNWNAECVWLQLRQWTIMFPPI